MGQRIMLDKYQKRYLEHQERKKILLETRNDKQVDKYSQKEKETLIKVITNRKSIRIYSKGIDDRELEKIIAIANLAPSSCNRHGVYIKKAPKKLVKLLVGGKGWCNKGTVLAFYADMKAYKSPYEQGFMPYLDAGVMAQNIYLYCEVNSLKCCFINPNTHNEYTSKDLLCGAIAIGK